jgi:hypothetical protein
MYNLDDAGDAGVVGAAAHNFSVVANCKPGMTRLNHKQPMAYRCRMPDANPDAYPAGEFREFQLTGCYPPCPQGVHCTNGLIEFAYTRQLADRTPCVDRRCVDGQLKGQIIDALRSAQHDGGEEVGPEDLTYYNKAIVIDPAGGEDDKIHIEYQIRCPEVAVQGGQKCSIDHANIGPTAADEMQSSRSDESPLYQLLREDQFAGRETVVDVQDQQMPSDLEGTEGPICGRGPEPGLDPATAWQGHWGQVGWVGDSTKCAPYFDEYANNGDGQFWIGDKEDGEVCGEASIDNHLVPCKCPPGTTSITQSLRDEQLLALANLGVLSDDELGAVVLKCMP